MPELVKVAVKIEEGEWTTTNMSDLVSSERLQP